MKKERNWKEEDIFYEEKEGIEGENSDKGRINDVNAAQIMETDVRTNRERKNEMKAKKEKWRYGKKQTNKERDENGGMKRKKERKKENYVKKKKKERRKERKMKVSMKKEERKKCR